MTVETPARPDQMSQELEALIAEARRRARRRRFGYAAAAGVLLVIAAIVLLGGGEDTRQTSDSGNGRPSPTTVQSDVLFVRAVVDSSEAIFELDPATGRLTRLRIRASCGDTPFCLISTGGELIVSSARRTTTYDPAAPTGERTARIGKGWITIPSTTDGRVWLGMLARGKLGGVHRRGLSAVREVDLKGNVGQSMRPPNGSWPVGAVARGLLFQYPRSLRLWSLEERRFTLRIPGAFPIDTSGTIVASCGDPCREASLTDTRTGTGARIPPPDGYRWMGGYEGAFSPDGSHLALPIAHGLAVVDTETRQARVIPGSDEVAGTYGAMAWSSDGERLFFAGDDGSVRSYRLGSDDVVASPAVDSDDLILQMVSVRPHE